MTSTSKKLFKGSFFRVITLVANILVGFFMMPFLVHSLGDDQYGIWILVGAVIGFYGLLDVGLCGAIVRFLIRAMHGAEEKEVNIALSTAVYLLGLVGVVAIIVTGLLIVFFPMVVDVGENVEVFRAMMAVLGLKVAIVFPLSAYNGVLNAKYRFDIASYIQLFSLVVRTSVVVLAVSNGYGVFVIAFITAVDGVIGSLLTVFVARRLAPEIRVRRSYLSRKKIKEYYNYGKYTYIATISYNLRFSIDNIVVGAFVSLEAVTHYAIAAALFRYFAEAMTSLFGVVGPVLNKYHKLGQWDNLREVYLITTELTIMASTLIGGMLIVLGSPFITVWMGEDYSDSYIVLAVLCFSGVVANAQMPSVSILYAIAKHKYYAKITLIEAVANVVISVVLAQSMGIYGVALGTSVPLLVNKLVYQPVYTCRQIGVPVTAYYLMLIRYLGLGALLLMPAMAVVVFYELDSYWELALIAAASTAFYVVASLKIVLSRGAVAYVREMVPGRLRKLVTAMS